MKAKKIIIAIMCLNLCLTAIACGNKKDNSERTLLIRQKRRTMKQRTRKENRPKKYQKQKMMQITML